MSNKIKKRKVVMDDEEEVLVVEKLSTPISRSSCLCKGAGCVICDTMSNKKQKSNKIINGPHSTTTTTSSNFDDPLRNFGNSAKSVNVTPAKSAVTEMSSVTEKSNVQCPVCNTFMFVSMLDMDKHIEECLSTSLLDEESKSPANFSNNNFKLKKYEREEKDWDEENDEDKDSDNSDDEDEENYCYSCGEIQKKGGLCFECNAKNFPPNFSFSKPAPAPAPAPAPVAATSFAAPATSFTVPSAPSHFLNYPSNSNMSPFHSGMLFPPPAPVAPFPPVVSSDSVSCPYFGCYGTLKDSEYAEHVTRNHKRNSDQAYICPLCSKSGFGGYHINKNTNLYRHICNAHLCYPTTTTSTTAVGSSIFAPAPVVPATVNLTGEGNNNQTVDFIEEVLSKNLDQECTICFDSFASGQKIARLVCLCIYHSECIHRWFSKQKRCPLHENN